MSCAVRGGWSVLCSERQESFPCPDIGLGFFICLGLGGHAQERLGAGEATDDPAAVREIDLAAVLTADMIDVFKFRAGVLFKQVLLKRKLAGRGHGEGRLGIAECAVLRLDLTVERGKLLAGHGQHLDEQRGGVDAVLAGDVAANGHAAGGLATYLSEKNYGHKRDGQPYSLMAIPGLENYWGTGVFATEALTREAIKALDKAKKYNQPFYLYMSHYAIHIPIDKDMRFYPKYLKKGLTEKEAAYASLIEGMDKSLGDLMDWLDKNDEADNTIIIFMSDNGGLASEPAWRDGELHTQNYPLNSGKGSLYEGGIREPMIVKWPGVVSPGTRCDKYLMIEDFYPTILEMAGVQNYRTVQPLDGTSFMPLLKGTGDPSKGRAIVWNFPNIWGNNGPGINLNCSIRKDEWKLVYYYETGKKELFNIPEDIGEKHDVAAQHPDIVKRLSKELGTYLRNVGGQRPGFKATNKPCPWPDEV